MDKKLNWEQIEVYFLEKDMHTPTSPPPLKI